MNWQDQRLMGREDYSRAIHQLGMNKSQAGRYLGVSLRTAQRYWDGDAEVPIATALLLRALLHYGARPVVPPWKGRRALSQRSLSQSTGG